VLDKSALAKLLDEEIVSVHACAGGDISQAFRLSTRQTTYFAKVNSAAYAKHMFTTELNALKTLHLLSEFRIPQPVQVFHLSPSSHVLIMEFIEQGTNQDFEKFGQVLAKMHKQTQNYFGFETHNYLGQLDQDNTKYNSFTLHYWESRIHPLVKKAFQAQLLSLLDVKTFERFHLELNSIFPEEQPSLIHGDLWNGNAFFDLEGHPVIFDPAIAYSSREFDLAMMHLFGGFPEHCFSAYEEVYAITPGLKSRLKYFQLYYLLAHLCMFGKTYHRSVMQCVKEFA